MALMIVIGILLQVDSPPPHRVLSSSEIAWFGVSQNCLMAVSAGGQLIRWRLDTWEALPPCNVPYIYGDTLLAASNRSDGLVAVVARGIPPRVTFIAPGDGCKVTTLELANSSPPDVIAFAESGQFLLCAPARDDRFTVVDITAMKDARSGQVRFDDNATGLRFSRDGKSIVFCGSSGSIAAYGVDGELRWRHSWEGSIPEFVVNVPPWSQSLAVFQEPVQGTRGVGRLLSIRAIDGQVRELLSAVRWADVAGADADRGICVVCQDGRMRLVETQLLKNEHTIPLDWPVHVRADALFSQDNRLLILVPRLEPVGPEIRGTDGGRRVALCRRGQFVRAFDVGSGAVVRTLMFRD